MAQGESISGISPREDFENVLSRFYAIFGAKKQKQLAECLDISPNAVSEAKMRSKIPKNWYLSAFVKKSINPVWLATGKGMKYLSPAAYPPSHNPETSHPIAAAYLLDKTS